MTISITVVWDQSQSNVVVIKTARLEYHLRETDPPRKNYDIHEQEYFLDPIAPSLHGFCWNALGDRANVRSLFSLGLAMQPCFDVEIKDNIYAASNSHFLSMALQCFAETTNWDKEQSLYETDLSSMLSRLGNLPQEIIFLIWKSLSPTIFRCLLSLQVSKPLLQQVNLTHEWSGVLLMHESMTIFFQYLHGAKYICGIRNKYQQYGYVSKDYRRIKIEMPVVAVSSILGLFGLQGIRYLMKDGTQGYVGPSIHNTEYLRSMTIASSSDIEPLFVQLNGDGLKIRSLLRAQPQTSQFGDYFTWEACWPISLLCARKKSTFFLHPRQAEYTEGKYRLFMRCIPFKEDGATLYGLSICCSPHGGIIGLASHFNRMLECKQKSSYAVWRGHSQGCILHIRLKPSERIIAIWIIHHASIFNYPYLIVLSSERHFYLLAPRLPPSAVVTKLLADESKGKLIGLYFDDSAHRPRSLSTIGAFCDSEIPEGRWFSSGPLSLEAPACHRISELRSHLWNQFSSRAILKNVSHIETCSVGVRCLGMILTYLDGHEKVLGQWYEHHPSANAVIHTLEPIPGQGLRFFLSYEDVDEYRYSYLERVELRSVKHGNDIHTVCDESMVDVNYGATIVWHFSTKSDVIDVD